MRYSLFDSPIGQLVLSGEDQTLTGIAFADSTKAPEIDSSWSRDQIAFAEVARQLRAYFAGELSQFVLQLAPRGTPFQRRVWEALRMIPYGSTTTYGKLAEALGERHSAQQTVR